MDTEGRIVPVGTPGEVWFRSYASMLKYWDEEEKTKELIRPDRWLKSGCAYCCFINKKEKKL